MARPRTKVVFYLAAAILAVRVSSDVVFPSLPDDSGDVAHNVTVNDSLDASKDIATARDLERQKEWLKAAGWYQTVLEKYRTRVVPSHGSDKRGNHYRGIVYEVQESLSHWPAEGVEAYRARYETTARQMLDLDDPAALQRIVQNYFLTESAKTAAMRLIDLHMEAGEFDAAGQIGDLLLDSYPKNHLTAERARLLFRTALAHHFGGDATAAAARADDLQHNFANAKGKVFGKEVVLSQSLASLLKSPLPSQSQSDSSEAWTMFNGSPDRAHVSTAAGHTGARIASIDLPQHSNSVPVQPQAFDRRRAFNANVPPPNDEDTGMTLGIMPVVDRGELFFQDGARVWARSLESGFPLIGWATTYGNAQESMQGVYQLRTAGIAPANAGGERGVQYTLTLTDNSVLGIMGRSIRTSGIYFAANREMPADFNCDTNTRLVCLDRKTGQERWHVSPGTIQGPTLTPDDHERLRALDFSGSPLIVNDSIYLIGRGGKDAQFENCYVICLDAANGHYRWSCLVAISNTPVNAAVPIDFASLTGTASHLAYSGGRIYINTNLGALASIDASTGSVVWLSLYRPDNSVQRNRLWNNPQYGAVTTDPVRPWEFNPVIAKDGKIFALPVDTKYLFVYEAASGNEIKAIDLSEFQPDGNTADEPRALLGVVDDNVVLSGADHVFTVKWADYDPTKSFADNVPQAVVYTSQLPSSGQAKSIRGRAFVTASSVLVTTDKAMAKLDIKKGLKEVDSYPEHDRDWADEVEGPGNVVASGEHVVIAGSRKVNIYTDMSLARARLDKAVAAAPNDVEPRLNYAQVMFGAGDSKVALEKLDEAVELLGGPDHMRPGDSRRKIFETVLNSAAKLEKDRSGEANEAAIKFYDLAAKAAELPHDQVTYRFSRAHFYEVNRVERSAEKGIALYQEILLHPDWRSQPFAAEEDANNPGVGGTISRAGSIAAREIAAIKSKNPGAYAAQENLATTAMTAAKASNDAAKLLAVAEDYPNSDAAPTALVGAAALYEKSNDAREATRVLRRVYRDYPKAPNRGEALEALARNYLRLPGGIQIAAARLGRAKDFAEKKLSQPLVLPDGKKIVDVSFKDASTELAKLAEKEIDAPLVDLHVPDRNSPANGEKSVAAFVGDNDPRSVKISDVDAILLPDESPAVHLRGDRLVVAMHDNLAGLIAPGNAKPLGTASAFSDAPFGAAWFTPTSPNVLVWSHNEIAALDANTAKPLWVTSVKSFPTSTLNGATGLEGVEVVSDSPPVPNGMNGGDIVVINGQVARRFVGRNFRGPVRINANQILLEDKPRAAPTGPERIVHAVTLGDRVIVATSTGRVACLKASDGTTIWQTPVSTHAIDRLVASADFCAVKVNEDGAVRLIVLDNSGGEIQSPIRSFPLNTGLVPQNIALSPDGMLVWTTPDRLCGKDLYEPGKNPTFEFPPRNGMGAGSGPIIGPQMNGNGINARFVGGNPATPLLYNGCTGESQLLIRGDRIFAVEQNGTYVAAHSLETGQLLTGTGEQDKETPMRLATGAASNSALSPSTNKVMISLSTAGRYLYVLGPRTLMAYDIDRPADDHWDAEAINRANPNYQIAIPTKTHLFVLGEPQPTRPNEAELGVLMMQVRLYDRGQVPDPNNPAKSIGSGGGNVDYIRDLKDIHGVRAAVPAEGGIFYLTGDKTLHFLAGAGS